MGKFNVSGLSIEDIMNIDFDELNKLSRSDLARLTSRLTSTANKRIKRLLKSDVNEISPALSSISQRLGKGKDTAFFSVKGKDVNQLRNEFARVKYFLNLKTSSITGTKKLKKETYKRLGINELADDWSSAKNKRFWKLYRDIVKRKGGEEQVNEFYGSDNIQQLLVSKFKWKRKNDDILNEMELELQSLYEENQENDEFDYTDIFG